MVLAAVLAAGIFASRAEAATCTWTNGSPGSWTTAGNWSGCGVTYPQSADTAIFDSADGQANLDANVTVTNLIITPRYAGQIVSNPTRTLTVTGDFSQGGGRVGNEADGDYPLTSLTVNGNTTLWGDAVLWAPATLTLGNAASDVLIIQDNATITGTTTGRSVSGLIFAHPKSTATFYFGTNTKASLTIEDPEDLLMTGYWRFDEPSGLPAVPQAFDLSNSANLVAEGDVGIAASTSATSMKFKNTYERTFDGTSDGLCVASDSHLEPGSTWTIAAWVYAATNIPDASGGTVIHGGNNYALRVQGGNNATKTANVMMRNTDGDYIIHTSTATFAANTWTHLAAVNDSNRLTIYINGSGLQSGAYAGEQDWDNTDKFCVGLHDTNTSYDFNGRIDDVRVYDDVLTGAQISALAAGRPAGTGGTHTYTLGDATTVTGDFIIDNGTVAAGSNTITVGGSWTNYGTFTGTGLVTMNGTTTGYTVKTNGNSFANLTFNGSGGGWTLSDALDVTGVITLTAGTVTASSYAITAQNIAGTTGSFVPSTSTVTLSSPTNVTVGPASFNNLTINSASSSGTPVEDTDLLALFQFEEGSGGTTADNSSQSHDGTLGHETSGTGSPSWQNTSLQTLTYMTNTGALYFSSGNASNNQRVLFTFGDDPSEITVSAWVKRTAAGDSWPRVVQLPYFRMYVGGTNDELGAYCDRASGTDGDWRTGSGKVPDDSNWYHVAVTYDLSSRTANPTFYVNGASQSISYDNGDAGTDSFVAGSTAAIGDDPDGSGSFRGWIDDVRIFGRILNSTEIMALAAGGDTSTITPDPGIGIFSVGQTTTAVSGTLTVTAGALNVPSGRTLNTTGAVTITDTLTIPAGGIMTANGVFNLVKAFTLGGSLTTGAGAVTFTNTVGVSSGATMTTGAGLVTLNNHLTVNGTYVVGGGRSLGGASTDMTINNGGTLRMNATSGRLSLATGRTLTMDGTLETTTGAHANQPIIDSAGTYVFKVGSGAAATPTLNINGLSVTNTDANGMFINQTAGSVTTIKRFDNLTFTSSINALNSSLLQVASKSNVPLTVVGEGLTFNWSTGNVFNLKLVDRDGDGYDVRAELSATCTGSGKTVCESWDQDEDTGGDTTPDDTMGASAGTTLNTLSSSVGSTYNDGPIVTFSGFAKAFHDSAGEIVGLPVVSFSWGTFAIRATYAAYNDVTGAGTAPALYKRNADGTLAASYTSIPAADGDLIGPPRWIETGGQYYVFLITTNGTVYKLRDDGASFTKMWQYRNHATYATATTGLSIDTTNVYWVGNGSTMASNPKFFSLKQTATPADNQTNIDASGLNGTPGSVVAGTGSPVVAQVPPSGYQAFFVTAGNIYKYATSTWTGNSVQPSDPDFGLSTVYGRATFGVADQRLYFVDDTGRAFGVGADLTPLWSYRDTANHGGTCTAGGSCMAKNLFYNVLQGYIYWGDQDGHVYAVKRNASTTAGIAVSNFPLNTNTTGFTNVFEAMPHYRSGVITVGATNGRLLFIDQQNASSAPKLIRTYQFSSSVSGVSYDSTNSRYFVATGDGKYFYIPVVSDPTSGNN